jgi:hypothetical protein
MPSVEDLNCTTIDETIRRRITPQIDDELRIDRQTTAVSRRSVEMPTGGEDSASIIFLEQWRDRQAVVNRRDTGH